MPNESETPGAAATQPEPSSPSNTTPPRRSIANGDRDSADTVLLADEDYWSKVQEDERCSYLRQVAKFYYALVDEFLDSSNRCVDNYENAKKSYTRWRWLMVWLTGTLAVGNVILASISRQEFKERFWPFMQDWLPLIVAIYAAVIAIFANLHSLYNHLERAQGFREARELFLDAHRDYEMMWQTQVLPFGSRSSACVNAGILYERIVARDRQLRARVKELTKQSGQRDAATADVDM